MFKSSVVVITGATSGVGQATARLFASQGDKVALIARGEEGLKETATEIEELGGTALTISADVADPTAVADAAQSVVDTWGGIDIWINNAMTTIFAPFTDIQPDEFRRATEVTYLGVVWGTKAALGHMVEANRGTIIQVGSALAYRGIPLQSAYCGSKHAIKGFTESVRTEMLHYGHDVHIGMVHLPAVNTPQFSHCRSKFDRHPQPVPPIYQPEVAAEAIGIAVREKRREMYVAWPTIMTIVGNKVASGLVDLYLAKNGVSSQLADRPAAATNAEGNLFHPVEGDHGAHGVFDDRSRSSSPELWMNENRSTIALVAGGLTILGWLARRSA